LEPVYEVDPVTGEKKAVGDWLYCNVPLSPYYSWNVATKHDIYLYGEQNGEELENCKLSFSNDSSGIDIEVIQATNNAVYFADGWKTKAGNPLKNDPQFFVNYYDYAGMYNAYKDHIFK
jgi:hypothetical protein